MYRCPMLTLMARPEPLSVDPRRMAVLVIDAQNDFAAPGECSIAPASTHGASPQLPRRRARYSRLPAPPV